MVCCAAYWRRHEIDEAGIVGSKLQKILFFLTAITAVSLLSFEATTMMCGASAMMLYAVGLVGAQKRNHRYLWAYGALSIFMMVMSLVFGLVLVGFVMSHRGSSQQPVHHSMPKFTPHGGVHWPLTKLESAGMIVKTPSTSSSNVKQHGVYVPELENQKQVAIEDVQKPHITFKLADADKNNNAKRGDSKVNYADTKESAQDDSTDDDSECDVQLTPLGYGVLALAGLLSLFLFALKVKSICLAFQMRRMLLSLANQRLPVTITAPQSSCCPTTRSCSTTPVAATATPMTRRDCERCTFVNAAGVSRCAMCDSPLSFVQAPINVVAPVPRVYAPGMYPLNQN